MEICTIIKCYQVYFFIFLFPVGSVWTFQVYKNEINPILTLKSTPLISKRICIWYLHVYSITNHATYPPFLIDAILISFGFYFIHFGDTLKNVRYELTIILFGRICAKNCPVYALHVTTHDANIEERVHLVFFLPFTSLMNVKALRRLSPTHTLSKKRINRFSACLYTFVLLMCGNLFRRFSPHISCTW